MAETPSSSSVPFSSFCTSSATSSLTSLDEPLSLNPLKETSSVSLPPKGKSKTKAKARPSLPTPKLEKPKEVTIVIGVDDDGTEQTMTFKPTAVLETLFTWMAERHAIFQRRLAGEPAPWTSDEYFQRYPFVNVYRVYDRMTQYIVREVISKGPQDLKETAFRVILFRFFARYDTWRLLQDRFGVPTWKNFDMDTYTEAFAEASAEGAKMYGAAYQMPPPPLGEGPNWLKHLRLLVLMMTTGLCEKLAKAESLQEILGQVQLYPSMNGAFLGYQLSLDLNLIPSLSFPENWSLLGPGATECLSKIFGPQIGPYVGPAVSHLHDNQDFYFSAYGIAPSLRPRLTPSSPPYVSRVDFEHVLCEVSKYARLKHPKESLKVSKKVDVRGRFDPLGKGEGRPRPTTEVPRKWMERQREMMMPLASKPKKSKKSKWGSSKKRKSTAAAASRARNGNGKTYECRGAVDEDAEDPEYEVSHIVMEEHTDSGSSSSKKRKRDEEVWYTVRWDTWGPEWDTRQTRDRLLEDGVHGVIKAWDDRKEEIEEKAREMSGYGASTTESESAGRRKSGRKSVA
ncbi:uncharacterized protein STEHIDRAFT_126805 [Stereum hirsutum FP-91666 SS1]|uniref:uncharacterized protein n=1 Tax=Stereum hirsutum (strain FP-91666) TaxID=721885 RepID=UPI000440AA37|nr:uncharacterized protein STEHIDRAFT_126805 [Stereum hirsutum FP-91666 SS1]EIM91858.1 hypothetical protein STEHIDRAFT_126805 [Stereum hirsutum FP-91666 SS1]